jgi:protein-L-isoaspartate(D-aspartate) O-methyltransferase
MSGKPPMNAVDRAIRAVDRTAFLPADQIEYAGDDTPLPIGHAQTISQPSLVAEMTRQLALTQRSRVLEVGTGSGYQTALLAEIAAEVFTIERLAELGESARQRLDKLGYHNIQFRIGDGAIGWPDAAPFDAIIVTAAPKTVPEPLVAQLAAMGRMVIPVGQHQGDQMLLLVMKDDAGKVSQRELFAVRFVPLISEGSKDD